MWRFAIGVVAGIILVIVPLYIGWSPDEQVYLRIAIGCGFLLFILALAMCDKSLEPETSSHLVAFTELAIVNPKLLRNRIRTHRFGFDISDLCESKARQS